MSKEKTVRHVCGISGGKDSAALAIYLKQQGRVPEMEYYFSDTGCELPETYDFIDRLEAYLGKKIDRIGSEAPFEHHLFMVGGMLPSPKQRWCTVKMKLEPFEKFVGTDEVMSYVAIRADEHREGYISTKPNIHPVFPFIHDEITRKDVFRILDETIGVPEYYKWRSRSGCYFCFFQRQEEWLGLYDNHPDLFNKAMELEKFNPNTGEGYSWIEGMSLSQLLERRKEIVDLATKRRKDEDGRSWQEILLEEGEPDDQGCLVCSL
ncbi:phosphoadenosine phosphosulfate reductase [Desulfolithobacter dissulfuricans]|uniref:Phosphoadenosine phosphosulfate reductase n=1 Tax=Desulfolithobacter dissulfuricans TaxID=2795293 RepID=A0A915U2A1_9BACT|nr:phosphoadenosine phosphosulfate reductase family protein [Desulfolithobacter dissulfuricans]BCO09227.1 phosphoadenosine phosphosulfate reductase [Desulfolithobacter dissulfuricans]